MIYTLCTHLFAPLHYWRPSSQATPSQPESALASPPWKCPQSQFERQSPNYSLWLRLSAHFYPTAVPQSDLRWPRRQAASSESSSTSCPPPRWSCSSGWSASCRGSRGSRHGRQSPDSSPPQRWYHREPWAGWIIIWEPKTMLIHSTLLDCISLLMWVKSNQWTVTKIVELN